MRGELDLSTRDQLYLACTARHHLSVVVDLSALIFMDCCGYGGLVAARNLIEAEGRTLTMQGARRQPGQMLAVIAQLERQPTLLIERPDIVDLSGVAAQVLPEG